MTAQDESRSLSQSQKTDINWLLFCGTSAKLFNLFALFGWIHLSCSLSYFKNGKNTKFSGPLFLYPLYIRPLPSAF